MAFTFNFRESIKKAMFSVMPFLTSLFLSIAYIYCFLFFYNLVFSFESKASETSEFSKLDFKVHEFSLNLDRSRLIFNKDNKGAIFSVENTHEYPMLVQTRILTEDKTTKSNQFFSTPPLFRLNGNNKSKVRVYSKDVNDIPNDRESLFWVCIKGIPPSNDGDFWSEIDGNESTATNLGVNVAVENCIKMMVRPKGIPSIEYDSESNLEWSIKGNKLNVNNLSNNYVTFKSLSFNGDVISSPGYIPPFGRAEYDVQNKLNATLEWSVITDLGGESKKYSAKVE